ncbi:hypothetical protein [Ruegeria atlantica]|nr:hypothetical protein [Ruegeria atlantica]
MAAHFGKYFGVDEHPDWQDHVHRLEAELKKNGEPFVPISWR